MQGKADDGAVRLVREGQRCGSTSVYGLVNMRTGSRTMCQRRYARSLRMIISVSPFAWVDWTRSGRIRLPRFSLTLVGKRSLISLLN